MKLSRTRINRAIKGTQNYLNCAENREPYTDDGGLTIYGCERRNLEAYKSMLDFKTLEELRSENQWLAELYQAI